MYKQYKLGHYSVLHTSSWKDVFTFSIDPNQLCLSPTLTLVWLHLTQHTCMPSVRSEWVLSGRNSLPNKSSTCVPGYRILIIQIMTDLFINRYIWISKRLYGMSKKMGACKMWIDKYFYSCKELKLGISKSSLVFWKMHSRNSLEKVTEIMIGQEEL